MPVAFAAARSLATTSDADHPLAPVQVHNAPRAPGALITHALTVRPHDPTPLTPYDSGLGVLPFYTYVSHPLNVCACGKKELSVNVANGNLILHTVEMQIHGTGLDLSLDGYYNSLLGSNYYPEFGQNWNLSLGRDVYLDETNPSQYVVLYGPSNYDAYFGNYNSAGGVTLVRLPLPS